MQIGVISDTHLTKPSEELIDLAETTFKDVSMVLHAGDLIHIDVLKAFAGMTTIAVRGNMDANSVAPGLPEQEVIRVKGFRIGLIHGWGAPWRLEERIHKRFERVDAIIYGHSHRAANRVRQGTLFFNPGAFSGTIFLKRRRSVGLLTVDNGISGRIIPI